MANSLFSKGKEKLLSADIDIPVDTIKAALVTNGYTLDLSHEFLSSLGANMIGTAQTLGSKTVTNGIFDAADPTWLALAAGSTVIGVVLYKDTGNAATSPLLYWIDVITGFPFVTNGSDATVRWDDGAYKIFAL